MIDANQPRPTFDRVMALIIAIFLGKPFVVDVIQQCQHLPNNMVLPAGWPLILFIWFVEARLIVTIVLPGSKWAMKMRGKNAFSLRSIRASGRASSSRDRSQSQA